MFSTSMAGLQFNSLEEALNVVQQTALQLAKTEGEYREAMHSNLSTIKVDFLFEKRNMQEEHLKNLINHDIARFVRDLESLAYRQGEKAEEERHED